MHQEAMDWYADFGFISPTPCAILDITKMSKTGDPPPRISPKSIPKIHV